METDTPAPPIPPQAICIGCGYDLTGLKPEALCPECATPCAKSLSPNTIYRTGPVYIRRLFLGSQISYWSILAFFVFLFVPIPALLTSALGFGLFAMAAAYLLPLVLWAAGWHLATPHDPTSLAGGESDASRRALRALVLLFTLNLPLAFIASGSPILSIVFSITLMLLCFGAFFTTAAYIGRIAIRAGNEEARKAAASARNLGAWAFVAIVLGVGTVLITQTLTDASLINQVQSGFFGSLGAGVAAVGLLMLAVAFDRAARHFARMMRTVHDRARAIVSNKTT